MLNGFTIKGNNSLLVINLYASSNCGHCEVSLCFEKKNKDQNEKKKYFANGIWNHVSLWF